MDYAPGKKLPDHLSPFVNDDLEGYTPKRREELLRIKAEKLGISLPEKIESNVEDLDDSEALEEEYLKGIEAETSGKSYNENQQQEDEKEEEQEKSQKKQKISPKKKSKKTQNKDGDEEDPEDNNLSGLLTNKRRRLYNKIEKGKARRQNKIEHLTQKRNQAEKNNNK